MTDAILEEDQVAIPGVRFALCGIDRKVELLDNFDRNFGVRETLNHLVGGVHSSYFFSSYVDLVVPQNASYVALDEATGCVIAMAINEIIEPGDEKVIVQQLRIASESQRLDAAVRGRLLLIGNFLERLEGPLDERHPAEDGGDGRLLYICMVSVLEGYQKRGIHSRFTDISLRRAHAVRCHVASADATSSSSRRAYESRGFERVNELPYASYRGPDGELAFPQDNPNVAETAVHYVKVLRRPSPAPPGLEEE